jgi:DNA-binding NarL/FixJ family response regulator
MLALFIDDNEELLELTKIFLKRINDRIKLETVSSVEEAYKKMDEKTYEILISDYQLPKKTGIQFLKELRENNNNIPFIFFTGKGKEEIAAEALRLGAVRYIQKSGDSTSQFIILAQAIDQEVMHWRTTLTKERQTNKLLEESRLLSAFKKTTEDLLQSKDQDHLTHISKVIKENFNLKLVWMGVITENDYLVHPIVSDSVGRDYLKDSIITWDDAPTSEGPIGKAIKTQKPSCKNLMVFKAEDEKPWYKGAIARNYHSVGAFPMIFQDKVIGTLNLYSEDEHHFTLANQDIYQICANLTAYILSTIIRKMDIQAIIDSESI